MCICSHFLLFRPSLFLSYLLIAFHSNAFFILSLVLCRPPLAFVGIYVIVFYVCLRERMNNIEIYRIILADERALLEPTFLSGNQKQKERNVYLVSSQQ